MKKEEKKRKREKDETIRKPGKKEAEKKRSWDNKKNCEEKKRKREKDETIRKAVKKRKHMKCQNRGLTTDPTE